MIRYIALFFILLLFSPAQAFAYCLESDGACLQSTGKHWTTKSRLFYSNGFAGSKATFDAAFVQAMGQWNNKSTFVYTNVAASVDPCTSPSSGSPGFTTSGWSFGTTHCGVAFGSKLVAVTSTRGVAPDLLSANIHFNSAYTWDLHTGPAVVGGKVDFLRVATHELGHALGLQHDDTYTALMNTRFNGGVRSPQPDDVAGLVALYGTTPLPADDYGNTMATAAVMMLGSTVKGRIGVAGDKDYFRIDVIQAGVLQLYTDGLAGVGSLVATTGQLLDANGVLISEIKDPDSWFFNIPASVVPGLYYLEVSASGINAAGIYTLHSSFTPRPANPGDDHGNSMATATSVAPSNVTPSFSEVVIRGVFEVAADVDYFRIDLSHTGRAILTVTTTGGGDPSGRLLDATGVLLVAENDAPSGSLRFIYDPFNFLLTSQVLAGTYYVEVVNAGGGSGQGYSLTVSVASDPDNDGVFGRLDRFPNDIAASLDSDSDGFPDTWNASATTTQIAASSLILDAFPMDDAASLDSDSDGYPDAWNINATASQISGSTLKLDVYPNDAAAALDSDGDSYPDAWNTNATIVQIAASTLVLDAFPNDTAAAVDSDGDGYPDAWNTNATAAQIAASSHQLDPFPTDPLRWSLDTTPPTIILLDANPMIIALNSVFIDPGSVVTDNVDSGLSAVGAGFINPMVPGTYTMTYHVRDTAGNSALPVIRIVNVVRLTGTNIETRPWVDAGLNHTVALKANGTVVAWGYNSAGQTAVPTGLNGVVAIAVGELHTVALKSDGTVVVWGDNSNGQSTIPTNLSNVIAIAAKGNHTVALKSDGTVVAWGDDSSGQSTVPAGLTGVTAIVAGSFSTFALKSDGTVVAWGSIKWNGSLPNLQNVTALAVGNVTVALQSNGNVVDLNSTGKITVPIGLSNVTAITSGMNHVLALKSDGNVVAWGNRTVSDAVMVPVGLKNIVAIAAGAQHSMALKADGSIVGWGYTFDSRLAVPTTLVPTTLIGSIADIGTGRDNTFALKSDGTIVMWGDDFHGKSTPPNGLVLFNTVPKLRIITPLNQTIAIADATGFATVQVQVSTRDYPIAPNGGRWHLFVDGIDQGVAADVYSSAVLFAGRHILQAKLRDAANQPLLPRDIYSAEIVVTVAASIVDLQLHGGWNLIGWPVADINYSAPADFARLIAVSGGKVRSIWNFVGGTGNPWQNWDGINPAASDSNFIALVAGKGYWVQMAPLAPGITVPITLHGVPSISTFGLQSGWNLMSGGQNVMDGIELDAFLSQLGATSAWSLRYGLWQSFVIGSPVFLNSLQLMMPDGGYYLKVP